MHGASLRASRRALPVIASLALLGLLAPAGAHAAKPARYEDTRGRFRLDLPSGWALAPQFGDVNGMVFQKKVVARRGTTLATLVVHIDDFAASEVKAYADKIEGELRAQPGFARVAERGGRIGGKPALMREFRTLISKEPRVEKTIQAWFLDASGHMYLLHFESPTSDFGRIGPDIEQLLAAFVPLSHGDAAARAGAAPVEAEPAPKLSGRWVNDDGLLLVLGSDGSFALAEAQGRYEVKDGQLTLIIPGQGREAFTFAHDASGGTLTLSSTNLGAPMVYRRMKGDQPPPKAAPQPDPGPPKLSPAASELVGRWSTPAPSGALIMELRADRAFTMGKMAGQWAASPDRLTLSRDGAELVSYRWRWSGDQLVLAGGDLDEEVTFVRQGR